MTRGLSLLLALGVIAMSKSDALAASPTLPAPATVAFKSLDGTVLTGALYRPATRGSDKVPVVVALHGCGGNHRRDGGLVARVPDWTSRWLTAGYAVLWPDSFTPRGLGPQCQVTDRVITPAIRARDAATAVAWIDTAPDLDARRVALVGWSNGGGTVLRAVARSADWQGSDVRLAIAFYPGCRPIADAPRPWQPRVPTVILMGGADDWTPPQSCRRLAAANPTVRYIEFPGAYHDFDAPDSPVRKRRNLAFSADGSGIAHVGTDPAARSAAIEDVTRRLAEVFR